MPKIPFHSHLSSVTLSILPLPFSALAKLQIRNKVNSLAFQVQFILTILTLTRSKKVKLLSDGDCLIWWFRFGFWFLIVGFVGLFCWFVWWYDININCELV